METNHTFFFAAGGVLNGIAQLVVLIACIILVIKQKSGSTIMMLVAQILGIFVSVGGFTWTALSAQVDPESVLTASKTMALLGPLPHILFAIGLIWFVYSNVKKRESIE
ncbi:hypothetical protein [Flagellimonas nanhaiensis]|uniref:Uncharacterized protein n=1 Tax=Flagellimonas nanhaiensis TaxID=2292706 RepID=A0A371JU27_9FLAO|nr:hypothetical protein [Allomuricauda nanhaiensis]RDY61295.1 hypothetical protein DX873_03770 [Allomuricauda nanhaiensis]